MRDAKEYDELWRSGGFEVKPDKHIQTPPIQATPNPNIQPPPATPPPHATQPGGMNRRDFLILGGVGLGGVLALGYASLNQSKSEPVPQPKPGPTEAPRVIVSSKPTNLPKPVITPTIKSNPPIDILGQEAIKRTFGISIPASEVPEIPFSQTDLKKASELNMFLVLRTDKTEDGSALTMENIPSVINPEVRRAAFLSNGIYYFASHLDNKDKNSHYASEVPQKGWALVSRKMIKNSPKKSYLEQTQFLSNYLKNEIFTPGSFISQAPNYITAADELIRHESEIGDLLKSNWADASKRLLGLNINQFYRQSPVEFVYDILVNFHAQKNPINPIPDSLEKDFIWTNRRLSNDWIMAISYARQSNDFFVFGKTPYNETGQAGCILSFK